MGNPSYSELEARIRELETELAQKQRAEQISTVLIEISNAVSAATSLDELYSLIHRSLGTIIDTTNFYIALYDERNNLISFPYNVDVTELTCEPIVDPDQDSSLTMRVIQCGAPLLIGRQEIVLAQQTRGIEVLRGVIPEIWLGVPLITQNKRIGAMAVQSYEGGTFYDTNDASILNAVASQVAMAIERKQIEEQLQDSIQRFRQIIENVDGIAIQGYDEERRVIFWNRASSRLYGYSEEEAMGEKLENLIIPPAMRDEVVALIDEWLAGGKVVPPGELLLMEKDGGEIPVFSSHVLYETSRGREMFCIDLDLGPIRAAEQSLHSAHSKFATAMDALDAVVYVADMQSHEILFLNTKAREQLDAELGSICWQALQKDQSGPCAFCTNNSLVSTNGEAAGQLVWEFENSRNGRWYQCRDQAIRWPDGRLVRMEIAFDISAQKEIELQLLESEHRHRVIFENSPLGMVYFDSDGTPLDWNERYTELVGKRASSLFIRDDRAGVHSVAGLTLCKALAGERAGCEDSCVQDDGSVIHLRFMFNPVEPSGNGSPARVIATIEDISARKMAEDAVQEAADRLEVFFSALNDAVFIYPCSESGCHCFIEVNSVACRRYGYSRNELLKLSVADIAVIEPYQHSIRLAGRTKPPGSQWVFEAEHRRRSGETFPVEINAAIIEHHGQRVVIEVARDISRRKEEQREREKLEAQLQQAQKLESIGRLAGTIAHDFNNMLSVILGRTEMLLDRSETYLPFREDLEEILNGARRSARLTRQLLTFASKQSVAPQVVDLNQQVSEYLSMLQRLIGERIELRWLPGENVGAVRVDVSQLDQVLTNLCVNARDAIGAGGTITISTSLARICEESLVRHEGVELGDYAVIQVHDDGCGIDPDIVEKIFEPFFTTKDEGKGTGLGLATVYGIVKRHKGCIDLHTVVGSGTTFSLFFPRYMPEFVPGAEVVRKTMDFKGRLVLIVEDEVAVLALATTMLKRLGCRVLPADSPLRALDILQTPQGQDVELVLTDVVMPAMDGCRLVEEIHAVRPGLPVLYMSGYPDDVLEEHQAMKRGIPLLQKPFTTSDLSQMLQRVLGRKGVM